MINLGNDYLYKFLGDLGYTGNLNDRWYDYLRDQGLTGTVNDMLYKLLVAFGFTGSVDDMWNKYIDSNNGIFTGFEKLRLDFTRGTLDSRITFSRTSNATITKSDGTIGYAPHSLLTYSEQFDNAAWTKASLTVTANNTTAPDNTTTADKLVEGVGSVQPIIYRSISTVLGNNVISYYLKAGERTWARIYTGANLSSAAANFNLATGVVGTTSNVVSANIVSVGNGWYRCSITALATLTSSANAGIQILSGDTTAAYTGDGTSGIYTWGAQLEIGSTATTYNPTTVKNLLGYTEAFDNAAWTKSNSFVQSNLLTYSEAFDNAAWTKSNGTSTNPVVTANAVIAPNGYQTADSVSFGVIDAAGDFSVVTQALTLPATQEYTRSIYVKATTANDVGKKLYFYVTDGTLKDVVTIVLTSEWVRVTKTLSMASGPAKSFTIGTLGSTYGGENQGAVSADIWGFQVVQGSVAGDYRRTDAAALPVFYPNHNGVVCAEKLVENTLTSTHTIRQAVTAVASTPLVYSCYLKASEKSYAQIRIEDSGGNSHVRMTVNLTDGTYTTTSVGSPSSIVSGVQSDGNGWYRCYVGMSAPYTSILGYVYLVSGTSTISYAGDGTSGIYIFGAQLSDSASLDPYVLNAAAAPSAQAYYGARFDYDPVTLAPKGLLIEESRVNLLLNSSLDGTNLATQNITTTAAARTLSFYGTGSITLSGTHSATVNGTGAYPTRTTYTYTPTAGTLTLTVSGDVKYAQDELGSFATSFIPTAGATVTRAADVAVIQGSNFYSWYNQNEGSISTNSEVFNTSVSMEMTISDGTNNNRIMLGYQTVNSYRPFIATNNITQSSLNPGSYTANVFSKLAIGYKVNDIASSINNSAIATDSSAEIPIVNRYNINTSGAGTAGYISGHIKQISYYNTRLPNSTLVSLTA